MRDVDIRPVLMRTLVAEFANSDALIVPELGLDAGRSRIDVAVVANELHGYEIKSERDTLTRLIEQAAAFNAVFDRMTLVVATKHLPVVRAVLPATWGLIEASTDDTGTVLRTVRVAKPNQKVQAREIAKLLWRDEALAVLKDAELTQWLRGNTRWDFWSTLGYWFGADELRDIVCTTLKARGDWREHFRTHGRLPTVA